MSYTALTRPVRGRSRASAPWLAPSKAQRIHAHPDAEQGAYAGIGDVTVCGLKITGTTMLETPELLSNNANAVYHRLKKDPIAAQAVRRVHLPCRRCLGAILRTTSQNEAAATTRQQSGT